MDKVMAGLSHLFMTVFLFVIGNMMVTPVITDVTVMAACGGGAEEQCSLAVYLSGFQQAAIGLGTMVLTPIIGNLSDKYGRKALLTLPLALSIIPPAILSYSRQRTFFYVYYVIKILTAMVSDGTVDSLALAYVAENVSYRRRTSAFSIMAGVRSIAIVCGTLAARFLPIAATFQVATVASVLALVYMRVFLKESLRDDGAADDDGGSSTLSQPILDESDQPVKAPVFKKETSLRDIITLVKTSKTFAQALVVAFFSTFSDGGMHSIFLYFLKAQFQFTKDQFADLMLMVSIVGSFSQLILLPMLANAIGEGCLLSIGLSMEVANAAVVSVSWAAWVPYLTTVFGAGAVIVNPAVGVIASNQVGPNEQGKAQGCLSAVRSLANVISPFVYSPLTALFLSDDAPFYFPGFSIMCIALSSSVGFIQSLFIRAAGPHASAGISKTPSDTSAEKPSSSSEAA